MGLACMRRGASTGRAKERRCVSRAACTRARLVSMLVQEGGPRSGAFLAGGVNQHALEGEEASWEAPDACAHTSQAFPDSTDALLLCSQGDQVVMLGAGAHAASPRTAAG